MHTNEKSEGWWGGRPGGKQDDGDMETSEMTAMLRMGNQTQSAATVSHLRFMHPIIPMLGAAVSTSEHEAPSRSHCWLHDRGAQYELLEVGLIDRVIAIANSEQIQHEVLHEIRKKRRKNAALTCCSSIPDVQDRSHCLVMSSGLGTAAIELTTSRDRSHVTCRKWRLECVWQRRVAAWVLQQLQPLAMH
jgi:hypothetical protein